MAKMRKPLTEDEISKLMRNLSEFERDYECSDSDSDTEIWSGESDHLEHRDQIIINFVIN